MQVCVTEGLGKAWHYRIKERKQLIFAMVWIVDHIQDLINNMQKTSSQMLVSIAHKYTFVNFEIETIFHQQSPPKTMACIVTM